MLKRIRNFARACTGLAAVEFGLIAPVLVTLLLGSVEVTDAVACDQKVHSMASATSDLVAQATSVSTSDVNDVFNAINTVLYPYPTTSATIIVTSIVNDPNRPGNYIVAWSQAQNGTPHAVGSSIVVPAGLVTTGGSVIYSEVRYTYSSPVTSFVAKSISMSSNFYTKPRASAQVVHT
jgi:Flp pilus assembly protein TadG